MAGKSWDKMRFPKPFGTAKLVYSEPIMLEKTKDKKAGSGKSIEKQLNQLVMNCDAITEGVKG